MTVALAPTKRARGFIAKAARFVPKSYQAIEPDRNIDAMKFAIEDRGFFTGFRSATEARVLANGRLHVGSRDIRNNRT